MTGLEAVAARSEVAKLTSSLYLLEGLWSSAPLKQCLLDPLDSVGTELEAGVAAISVMRC